MAEYWTAKRKEILAAENGTINKVDVGLTVALCYPNSYYVGMSNLGFHAAYRNFNAQENSKAERAFFEHDTRPLTIESGRSLQDFSCVGFSISFELDYDNILAMLAFSKIPLLREDRAETAPIVFAGGFLTFFNCKPLIPFVDFLFLGESEESMPRVIDVWLDKGNRCSKKEILVALSDIPGIYVPGISTIMEPQIISDLDRYETHSCIVSPLTEFKDMHLVEIARGCFHSCNFCVSGHVYKKPRVRSIESIMGACEEGLVYTNKVGMIAGAPSDYPHLSELIAYIRKRNISISFSSLRASSITDELLGLLSEQNKRSLTLAPETGSEELRSSISKGISNERFFSIVRSAKTMGFNKVKLYIMIGLPGETDLDCDETVSFIKAISVMLPTRVSMTPFIPKPMTPYSDYSVIEKRPLKERIKYYRARLKLKNVRLQFDGVRSAEKQALYAKGDERLLHGVAHSFC